MTIFLFFQGDSGGPLTFKQNGQHVLIGDVSRGQSDSARVGQRSEVTSQSQSTIFLSETEIFISAQGKWTVWADILLPRVD